MRVIRRSTVVAAAFALLASVPAPASAWPTLEHSVPDEVAQFYDPSVVRSIQLTIAPGDWDMIRRDSSFTIQVPATIAIDGTTLPAPVSIRRKSGVAVNTNGQPSRIALKVYLDEYDDDQDFMGVTKLSLEGAAYSPVLEGLAWWVHQSAAIDGAYGSGYDPALAAWVNVDLNGQRLGLYLNVEDRGKRFLKNRDTYESGETWLFKRSSSLMEVDVGEGTSPQNGVLCFWPFGDPQDRCGAPRGDAAVTAVLSTYVDVQAMVAMWAADAFMCNWDSMLGNGNNHFWADFAYGGAPLRRYYPWDMDRGWDRMRCSVFAINGSANGRTLRQSSAEILLLNNPTLRTAYREALTAMLMGPLSVEAIDSLMDDLEMLLTASMLADPHATKLYGVPRQSPAQYLEKIRGMLLTRRALVLSQLAANVPAPRAS